MPTFVSFSEEKTQVFDYTYNAKVRNFERSGPSGKRTIPHMLVKAGGADAWLPISSTRLVAALKALGKYNGKISVTQEGEGFNTQYDVTAVKAK
jgi:hypothetical protein